MLWLLLMIKLLNLADIYNIPLLNNATICCWLKVKLLLAEYFFFFYRTLVHNTYILIVNQVVVNINSQNMPRMSG